ncbi:MAG: DUF1501 domain-containing protein [Acidobacteria bacterium]|nr:DUF1501 domain-containing protein [Acidobacteriota bacterium]MCA1610335.1 DUF1501 domain-containing protein [Acidobacteriota bacterium]MCA1617386.1 DUF1501 domain-containing protein [Acidobacteriota bacterium]
MLNRRIFLKSGGLALVAGGFLPKVFVRMASGATPASRRVLVAIFQRGAVDGLNVVVPYAEKAYYDARPSIAIPRPGSGENAALDLDGFFGLHPALSPVLPLFKDGSAAFVHAVGSPDATRSHFDAQDFMESGTPGVKSTTDGFLSRAVSEKKMTKPSPLRALAVSASLPRILSGSAGAVSMTNVADFGIRGGASSSSASDSFEAMYGEAVAGTLQGTARDSFEAVKILKSSEASKISPQNGAEYPKGPFGNSLKQIAQLIKANVGMEVAFTDVGGWDTHAGEGGVNGQLSNRLRDYGQAIAAFTRDLGSRMADVTLVTMSEFGRTVHENGNRGTDHGHANVMLLAGGGVKGGRVYGKWPGLESGQLYENRDVAVTTDFRDVFAEILARRMGIANLKPVFPGYGLDEKKRLGVIA